MQVISLAFIIAGGMFLLPLVAYPIIAIVSVHLRDKKKSLSTKYEVPISVIVACYNEEKYIRDKILSIIDPKEWIPGSELIVVSGGSTDGTNNILREFSGYDRIQLITCPERLGKITSVNLAFSLSKHDILVFSDCRQKIEPGSIRNLIGNFRDPEIGTVSATLLDGQAPGRPSSIRMVLNAIAFFESARGSSLNLFGALYAQRRSVYRIIPEDLLFDDLFVIVCTILQRKRIVQERDSIIYDVNFHSYYSKSRIERSARGLLLFLFRHGGLIIDLPTGMLFRFMLYKYARLILPFILAPMIAAGLYLMISGREAGYLVSLVAGLVILMSAERSRRLACLIFRVNWSYMTGTLRFLFLKERSVYWEKIGVDQG